MDEGLKNHLIRGMETYSVRELKTSDIFKMSKILKKMNLKIKANAEKIKDENGEEIVIEKTQKQVGAEFILSIFENLHLAENEVNNFLADMVGIAPEEFAELPIEKTLGIIKQFKEIGGLSSFLKQANQ